MNTLMQIQNAAITDAAWGRGRRIETQDPEQRQCYDRAFRAAEGRFTGDTIWLSFMRAHAGRIVESARHNA